MATGPRRRDASGDRGLHDQSPPGRRHCGRGRGGMVSAASHRGRRVAVHPRARIPTFPRVIATGVTSTPAMTTAWEECSDKVGGREAETNARISLSSSSVSNAGHRSSSAGPMGRAPDICRISSPSGSKSSPALPCSSLPHPSLPEPVSHPFRWQEHRLTSRCPSAEFRPGICPRHAEPDVQPERPGHPRDSARFPSPPRSGQRSRSTGRNPRATTSSTVRAVLATHT